MYPFVFWEVQTAIISQKVSYFGIFWMDFVITDKEIPVEDIHRNAKHNHPNPHKIPYRAFSKAVADSFELHWKDLSLINGALFIF